MTGAAKTDFFPKEDEEVRSVREKTRHAREKIKRKTGREKGTPGVRKVQVPRENQKRAEANPAAAGKTLSFKKGLAAGGFAIAQFHPFL